MRKLKLLKLFFTSPRECAFEILAADLKEAREKRVKYKRERKDIDAKLQILRNIVSFRVYPGVK